MDFVAQWYGIDINLQVWRQPEHAGHSLTFNEIEGELQRLAGDSMDIGEIIRGEFGGIAKLTDPDRNEFTLAEAQKG